MSRVSHAGEPGVYRATAEVRRPGQPAGRASASMLVGGADSEMADPRLNVRVLQRWPSAPAGGSSSAARWARSSTICSAAVPAAALLVQRDLWHNGWSFAGDPRAARG